MVSKVFSVFKCEDTTLLFLKVSFFWGGGELRVVICYLKIKQIYRKNENVHNPLPEDNLQHLKK